MTTDAANAYVYAVLPADAPAALDFKAVSAPGVAPERLDVGAHAVIWSPIEVDEVLSTRRNMLAHAKALETLMAEADVLPMRFGLIARDPEQIAATVARHEQEISAQLTRIAGAVEIGVTIDWRREDAMRTVVDAAPALKRAYVALQGRPERETHYERIELGRQVAAGLDGARRAQAAAHLDALAPLARAHVVADVADDETAPTVTALKADFLVDRAAEPALYAAADALQERHGEEIAVSYVGPSPAYNFVELRLNWAAPTERRAAS